MRAAGRFGVEDPAALLAAGLMSMGCALDGWQHLLDEGVFSAELIACAHGLVGAPWLNALCGRRVQPDSMMAGPRPMCPGCEQLGRPLLLAVRGPREPRQRRLVRSGIARLLASGSAIQAARGGRA